MTGSDGNKRVAKLEAGASRSAFPSWSLGTSTPAPAFPKTVVFILVPKLQLGNREAEAPASRDWKLELPGLHSQAGAWERVQK